MSRVDLELAIHAVGMIYPQAEDDEWLLRLGRELKRGYRLDAAVAHHRQSTAITTRVEGWRKFGEPKGYSFAAWSTMDEAEFRRQCHLGVARGSTTAEYQLALLLVSNVRAA